MANVYNNYIHTFSYMYLVMYYMCAHKFTITCTILYLTVNRTLFIHIIIILLWSTGSE